MTHQLKDMIHARGIVAEAEGGPRDYAMMELCAIRIQRIFRSAAHTRKPGLAAAVRRG